MATMLKPQDCVLLLKLLADKRHPILTQRELAVCLCISLSEINEGIKRLLKARLLRKAVESGVLYPVIQFAEEFLITGLKYAFPVQLGEYTRGIATGIAAPVFKGKIVLGDEPIPVWPYAQGKKRGLAVEPLYRSVPKSISEHSDQNFYDLLALVDVIRIGRVRERNIAIELLKEKLNLWGSTEKLEKKILP